MISIKKTFPLLFIFSLLCSTLLFASGDKVKMKIKVWGNCGMCHKTIVSTVKSIDGVIFAKWSSETKILVVKFLSEQTDIDEIQKKIASVGYDTENYKADNEVYNKLHHCCKYDRK